MNLVAYIRVSTEEQAGQGHSIGHQLERVQAYCALHQHQLTAVFSDEGVSASIPLAKRRGGAQLIDALRNGVGQGVVIVRLDRLFRNALDGLRFFEEELNATDASVHSVTEVLDTSTPSGFLALIMQLAVADYARRLDVQRGRETNRALREQGKVFGTVPYGCVAVGGEQYADTGDGRQRTRGAELLRDPRTWNVRCFIVSSRGAGATFAFIANQLRAGGVPSPAGARGWSKSTLRHICETHHSLLHLPFAPSADDGTAVAAGLPETEVSHARH